MTLTAALLALGFTAAACGDSEPDTEGAAPAADSTTTTAPAADDSTPAGSAESDGGLPAVDPAPLDLTLVEGASEETSTDEESGVVSTWVSVPEADALNERVATAVEDAEAALAADGEGADLSVHADLVASGPGALGITVTAQEDGVVSDVAPVQTLWFDGTEVVELEDLFADESAYATITGELGARLGVSGYALAPDTDVAALVQNITFDERGDVRAAVSEAELGEGDGVIEVFAPTRQTLSEFGEAAREAMTEPAPFDADAAPADTP